MSERDGTMMDVASTYVLCPHFEEPMSVNFRLRRKEESCGAEVGWIKMRSDGIKVWSDRIKMRSKGDQNVEQRGSECGAKWIKMQIKMRSKVEQRILFLFDSKLESCLEASSFKYRIMEILEKGL